MRVLLCIFAVSLSLQAGDTLDLYSKMEKYLAAMDVLSPQEAETEVDFMITCVQDSVTKSRVAQAAYRHFRESKVMGSENVAVWIYDHWFADFRVLFDEIDDFEEARLYAFVNRASLLGEQAPKLSFPLVEPTSRADSIAIPRKHRPAIIYFYTTGCPKCLVTDLKIRDLLNDGHYKVDVFTIYTGDDTMAMRTCLSNELNIINTCHTKVYNLNGGDVDYVVPYAVVQTPKLFLVDRDGRIVGRNLDGDALKILLERVL